MSGKRPRSPGVKGVPRVGYSQWGPRSSGPQYTAPSSTVDLPRTYSTPYRTSTNHMGK